MKFTDRHVVFILVAICLSVPIVMGISTVPAPMKTANKAFDYIESLPEGDSKGVVVALDFGPGTSAENKPQAKLVMEHLMRKRIPFAVTSLYVLSTPFLKDLPQQVAKDLEKENPSLKREYGRDWVNLGYFQNGTIFLQSLARSEDWISQIKADVNGTPLEQLPVMKSFKNLKSVSSLVELTGLTGVFSSWLQFFQTTEYTPVMIHGCTSITIPDAFIFFSSGQIRGFFEGIAGAAWYEERIKQSYPQRVLNYAQSVNTGTSFAQLMIIFIIIIGNIKTYLGWRKKRSE